MRPHFVLDASALIPFFSHQRQEERLARRAIVELLKRSSEREAVLHVPDFCMAECSKALARIAFAQNRVFYDARDAYRRKVDELLGVVSGSRSGLVHRMALTRQHLVDIEDIFLLEYALRPREKDRLSGLDALVISMARQHARQLAADRVFIVTADAWLATVCNESRLELPRAIDTLRESIPR